MCILDLSRVSTSLVLYTHVTRGTVIAAQELSSETERAGNYPIYLPLMCRKCVWSLSAPSTCASFSNHWDKAFGFAASIEHPVGRWPCFLDAQRNFEDKVELVLAFSPQNCILFWPGQSHSTVILADYGAREARLLSVFLRSNFEWMNWGLREIAKWGGDDG